MPDPTYYETDTDIDALHETGVNDEDSVTYVTDERWADPLDEGDTDDWRGQSVAAATPEEHAEWRAAYGTFTSAVDKAKEKLEHARAAWKAAQGIATAQIRDAVNEYRPTHEAIERRVEAVEKLREEARLAELARKAQAAADAQAAEDAEQAAKEEFKVVPEQQGELTMTYYRPGPDLFAESISELDAAFPPDEPLTDMQKLTTLLSSLVSATQAQVAASVLLAEVIADASNGHYYELGAWRRVLPVNRPTHDDEEES